MQQKEKENFKKQNQRHNTMAKTKNYKMIFQPPCPFPAPVVGAFAQECIKYELPHKRGDKMTQFDTTERSPQHPLLYTPPP